MVSPFVRFLYERLTDPKYSRVIRWNAAGTAFSIKDWESMRDEVFPEYRGVKWSTFMKNFYHYRFRKVDDYYSNPYFTRENPQLEKVARMRRYRPRAQRRKEEDDEEDAEPISIQQVVGYIVDGRFSELEKEQNAFFYVRGRFMFVDSRNLEELSRNSVAVPCVERLGEVYLLPKATFTCEDPEETSLFRVEGYLQGQKWVNLAPGETVEYYFNGRWCPVQTNKDAELAQQSKTCLVRDGRRNPLPLRTSLYMREVTDSDVTEVQIKTET